MNANQIIRLADELGLPVPVKDIIAKQMDVLPLQDFSALISQLTDPRLAEEAQERLAGLLAPWEGETGMAQLTVMLAAACHTREIYAEKNLPDNVFLDTMGCFLRFLLETRKIRGEWVFDRAFWTWRQTACCLFRLGTLEFEYCPVEDVTSGDIFQKSEMVVSVHIPSDAHLTEKELADSYQNMSRFFAVHGEEVCLSGKPQAVLCSSWLLSPRLYRLLGPDSGIRRFASGFELLEAEYERESCFRWLFNGVEEPYLLPEETSLQRAVKAHLLKGGKIGAGTGVLKDGGALLP